MFAQTSSDNSKAKHLDSLKANSYWPDKIEEAESTRRLIVVLEVALAPVITNEGEEIMSKIAIQINMDLGPMIQRSADGQRYIWKFDNSIGGGIGLALHRSINDSK